MFEFKFQDEDIYTNLELCCNQIWAFQGHWISLLLLLLLTVEK